MATEIQDAPVETEDTTAADVQSAFESGYENDPPVETPTDQAPDSAQANGDGSTQEPPPESGDQSPPPSTDQAPATPTEPEYVHLTKAQLAELEDGAKTANELAALGIDPQIRKLFGKVGNVEDLVKSLQDATPAGQDIVVSESDFEEMTKEDAFPEIASMLVKGLNRAFAKAQLKGTAPAPPPEFDPTQFKESLLQDVSDRLQAERAQNQKDKDEAAVLETQKDTARQLVADEHSDWDALTKSPQYLEWVATQPQGYQNKIKNTWDPSVVIESVTAFKASQAPPHKPTNSRADQLREGITPRGSGVQHTAHKTVEDEFEDGYAKG